jgi:hypothetical protein
MHIDGTSARTNINPDQRLTAEPQRYEVHWRTSPFEHQPV